MRMIDDMYAQGRLDLQVERFGALMRGETQFPAPVPVVIDNVAQYTRDMVLERNDFLSAEDFPYVVSPWPRAFFEFGFHNYAANREPRAQQLARNMRLGAMVTTYDAHEKGSNSVEVLEYIRSTLGDYARVYHQASRQGALISEPKDFTRPEPMPRWVAIYEVFLQRLNEPAPNIGLNGLLILALSEEGAILKPFSGAVVASGFESADDLPRQISPVFMACSFLHAKNITTERHETPAKVARKRAKAGKPVGETFHTIVIEPMKRTLAQEGRAGESGIKHALHLCRGHFRTYTKEKPLFGKFVGTVYVPMHARGSKGRGTVEKEYVVNPPREEDE